MKTKIIEATNGPQNWGKFLLGRFDYEWGRGSIVAAETEPEIAHRMSLLSIVGHSPRHILVLDLETCEGAIFEPRGCAHADLEKHKIWVCPLFEPFLEWLYQQNLEDLDKLPAHIDLPDAPFAMYGHRREGIAP